METANNCPIVRFKLRTITNSNNSKNRESLKMALSKKSTFVTLIYFWFLSHVVLFISNCIKRALVGRVVIYLSSRSTGSSPLTKR